MGHAAKEQKKIAYTPMQVLKDLPEKSTRQSDKRTGTISSSTVGHCLPKEKLGLWPRAALSGNTWLQSLVTFKSLIPPSVNNNIPELWSL